MVLLGQNHRPPKLAGVAFTLKIAVEPVARTDYLTLKNAVEPYCKRLLLETERFFLKNGLTVVMTTAFTHFLEKNAHFQRIRRSRYGFNCVF